MNISDEIRNYWPGKLSIVFHLGLRIRISICVFFKLAAYGTKRTRFSSTKSRIHININVYKSEKAMQLTV